MDINNVSTFITLDPSKLFNAEGLYQRAMVMYEGDEDLIESFLKEHLASDSLAYAMHLLEETSSTSYMGVKIHYNGTSFSAPTAGVYGVKSRPEIKARIKAKVLKRNETQNKAAALRKEDVEVVDEGKGKKEPRWQDDDCDGKWYEKSDTDGKISKREKKAKEKAYSEEVETTEGKKIKEAFAFSNEEFEELAQLGEEIDAMSDEELVDLMIESIHEIAEDDQDLIEICEHLEETEVLTEAPSKHSAMPNVAVQAPKKKAPERDAGSEARKRLLAKKKSPSRMERLKSAAKKAGAAVKAGVKKVGKKVVQTAGKVAGEFSAAKEKQKEVAKSRTTTSDNASTTTSRPDSGGSDGGGEKKKGPGLLRRIGGAIKRGLKKAVGKTARAVSKGSNKLATRLGESYDEIAHLYESDLFSIEEIEYVILEKEKENAKL